MTAQRKEGDEGARRQVKRAALSSIGRLHIFRLTVGPFAVLVLITDGVGTLPSIRSGALGPEASDAGWRPLLPAHRVSRIRRIGTDVARSPARRPTPRARLAPAPGRGQHDLDSGRSRVPRWNNPYGGARRRRAADALRRGLGEEVPPADPRPRRRNRGKRRLPARVHRMAHRPRRRRARTNADAAHADASSVADHRARRQTHAGVAPGRATQR